MHSSLLLGLFVCLALDWASCGRGKGRGFREHNEKWLQRQGSGQAIYGEQLFSISLTTTATTREREREYKATRSDKRQGEPEQAFQVVLEPGNVACNQMPFCINKFAIQSAPWPLAAG